MPKPLGVNLQLPGMSATPPDNPPSGSYLLYFKNDGKLYAKNSAGVETPVDSGGSGGGGGGNGMLSGLGPPDNTIGAAGDFYFDDTNNVLYGPRIAGDGLGAAIWAQDASNAPTGSNVGDYRLGNTYQVLTAGQIVALRFYRDATTAVEARTLDLYENGVLVATSDPTSETATSGWVTAALSTPVPVTPGYEYTVAMTTPTTGPYVTDTVPPTLTDAAQIAWVTGRFDVEAANFPGQLSQTSNFFLDLQFEPSESLWPIALADVSVQPNEPVGAEEGHLWYDSDDEDAWTVDVSYIQPDEPTGAEDGSLWLDTDDTESHTSADHAADFAPLGHVHAPPDLSGYATDSDLTTGLAGKADASHEHGYIKGVDGRVQSGGLVEAPAAFSGATYQMRRIAPRFHSGSELGLPQAWYSVETISPWGDDSGGGVHQVARGFGETWERYGLRSGTWGPWRIPGGGWQKIATVNPSGSSSTVGNLTFTNIPTIYKRLRIRSSYLQVGTGNTNSHLYMRFNSDAATNYGNNMQYHTTGTWNGTYSSSQAQGYAAYNYFYSGTANTHYNMLEVLISNTGLGIAQWQAKQSAITGAASYTYGSECVGNWNSVAAITRIDLWAGMSYTWDSDSVVTLEGSLEI